MKSTLVFDDGQRVQADVFKMIRHEEGEYCVYSADGSRGFGCYPSMQEALNRLEQIERFTEKARSVSVGDHVLYAVPKPPGATLWAHGKVERVETSGEVSTAGSEEVVVASPEEPAAVVRVWADLEQGYRETDRRVVVPVSALRTSSEPLAKEVSAQVREALQRKADEHNEDVGDTPSKRTTLRTLTAVFERGVGAYRTNPGSVRPNVTGAEQWAYARVNGFLHALRTGDFKRSPYDQDLLPDGHPLSSKTEKAAYKREESGLYPMAAYAYTPDSERPSTWKLLLWDSPTGGPTRASIGRTLAALGAGFRGQRVQLPEDALEGVKRRVLQSWRQVHDAGDEVPEVLKEDTFEPPLGVVEEGRRALQWISEGHAGANFTDVGRARASQLARGDRVSLTTIQRIANYLSRHQGDKDAKGFRPGEDGYPTPGRVAWAAWGGDPAISWTRGILDRIKKDACPVATQNIEINLRNRQTAIESAMYGPPNPLEENTGYWQRIAERWDVPIEEARTMRCGNCAAFDMTDAMLRCIDAGVGEDVREQAHLGYCHVFDFKCAAARTCSAWLVGGPITGPGGPAVRRDLFLRKEESRRFTLGPLYVPDTLDAHGEWATADDLQHATWEWVRTGDRRVFLQHDRETVAGEWVEVMTVPQEWTVQVFDGSGQPAGTVTFPAGTVFLGVVWEPWAWRRVHAGQVRGYSIGGRSFRDEQPAPLARGPQ